jgi:hypothetical protein
VTWIADGCERDLRTMGKQSEVTEASIASQAGVLRDDDA